MSSRYRNIVGTSPYGLNSAAAANQAEMNRQLSRSGRTAREVLEGTAPNRETRRMLEKAAMKARRREGK